jgi:hypothetical protein
MKVRGWHEYCEGSTGIILLEVSQAPLVRPYRKSNLKKGEGGTTKLTTLAMLTSLDVREGIVDSS